MKFELYKDTVLTRDVPEHRLKRGDIVKLVDHNVARDGSEGDSIEVFNAVGDTIAVTAVMGLLFGVPTVVRKFLRFTFAVKSG